MPVAHEQPQINASFVANYPRLPVKFYVSEGPLLLGYGMLIARQGHNGPHFSEAMDQLIPFSIESDDIFATGRRQEFGFADA
jgi:hypothetical protein